MDDVILKSGTITVTKTMAKFGDTSYPIANIGAVSIEESEHWLGGLGVIMVVAGLAMMFFGNFGGGTAVSVLGAVLVWYAIDKGTAKLMLRTSSGNQQAFESKDKTMVKKVKSSIEEAIAARG